MLSFEYLDCHGERKSSRANEETECFQLRIESGRKVEAGEQHLGIEERIEPRNSIARKFKYD
jgi:hypothetical protein